MYLGRVIGFGTDKNGRSLALYAFSDPDKRARACIPENKLNVEVEIHDRERHNAMRVASDHLIHVADGKHCDIIFNNVKYPREDIEEAVRRALDEAKGLKGSCRLAVVVDGLGAEPVCIGIKMENRTLVKEYRDISPGKKYYISSEVSDPREIRKIFYIQGETAQDLADNFFDWMDKDKVSCTGAAVFNPEKIKWELAVRNR